MDFAGSTLGRALRTRTAGEDLRDKAADRGVSTRRLALMIAGAPDSHDRGDVTQAQQELFKGAWRSV